MSLPACLPAKWALHRMPSEVCRLVLQAAHDMEPVLSQVVVQALPAWEWNWNHPQRVVPGTSNLQQYVLLLLTTSSYWAHSYTLHPRR